MALWIAGIAVELREVKLASKPPELAEASPKATVPVLVLNDGTVVDESIAVARWALSQSDPENWLSGDDTELIAQADGPFKHHLDRYKYPNRYEDEPGFGEVDHQAEGLKILNEWDARVAKHGQMTGPKRSLADIALFPFIRQFANHNRAWFDAQKLPHLHPWLEAHLASNLFTSIMPKFTPWKAGDASIQFGPQSRDTILADINRPRAKLSNMQTLAPTFSVSREDRLREIHWAVGGFWDEKAVIDFSVKLLEISKPFRDDKKGFKALGDVTEFVVQNAEMAEHIRNTQQVSASVGVMKLAVLYSSTLVKQQFRRVSEAVECQFFTDREAALAWLRSG